MKKPKFSVSLFSVLLCYSISVGQTYHIDLARLTSLDDEGLQLTVFSSTPKQKLILQASDTSGARFFEVFYSWKVIGHPEIAVMVVPGRAGEMLYIDFNNNKDLTDDGPPAFFPYAKNDFAFDIVAPNDPQQRTKILLQRRPSLPDSLLGRIVLTNGDLNPRFTRFWGEMSGQSSYDGRRGTFFFDSRVSVRRGMVTIQSSKYEIGVFDYSNNGLFNDDDDILLVDLNLDGKLNSFDEGFALNDVFTLGAVNLAVSRLDPYGKWIDLTVTTKPATSFLTRRRDTLSQNQTSYRMLDEGIWSIQARTLEDDTLALKVYKGKFLLLNFWGEWCQPCLAEIPALIQGNRTFGSKNLQILSFLKSSNLRKAKALIQEKSINWPQLILSTALEKQFGIRSYPTNILILPDGRRYIQVGQISPTFFETHVQ